MRIRSEVLGCPHPLQRFASWLSVPMVPFPTPNPFVQKGTSTLGGGGGGGCGGGMTITGSAGRNHSAVVALTFSTTRRSVVGSLVSAMVPLLFIGYVRGRTELFVAEPVMPEFGSSAPVGDV